MTAQKLSKELPSDPVAKVRYLADWYGSLLDASIVLDVPYRRITSWVTGEVLRIKPSRGRGKYGTLSLFSFALARLLLDAGISSVGVQFCIDWFFDPTFLSSKLEEKMGCWVIVREHERPEFYGQVVATMYSEPEKFAEAVKAASAIPTKFAAFYPNGLVNNILERLLAFLEFREPKFPTGEKAKKALTAIRRENLAAGRAANQN
jgi:hypothetical protein